MAAYLDAYSQIYLYNPPLSWISIIYDILFFVNIIFSAGSLNESEL